MRKEAVTEARFARIYAGRMFSNFLLRCKQQAISNEEIVDLGLFHYTTIKIYIQRCKYKAAEKVYSMR